MSILSGIPKPVRQALKWDSTSGLLTGVFTGAVVPFVGVVARQDLHASVFLIALMSVAGSVGNLLNPLVAHQIRDRAKLPFAVRPLYIGRFFYLLMPFARVSPVFIALACCANAVSALSGPAYAAVIRDAYPMQRRGQYMGLVRILAVVGAMLGALWAGGLLTHLSYRWVFAGAGVVGVLGAAAFSRIGVRCPPGEPPPGKASLMDGFRAAKKDKAFQLYSTCFYLYGLGNLLMMPVIPVLQVDELHITPLWVGYLATTASACSILGYVIWGRLLDRHGPFRLILFSMLTLSISPIVYATAHSVPVLLIAAVASGVASAGGDLGYVNAALRFGRRDSAALYAGVFAFLQGLRGIPGPLISAGLSVAVGPRPVFLIALACWLASMGILLARGGLRLEPRDPG